MVLDITSAAVYIRSLQRLAFEPIEPDMIKSKTHVLSLTDEQGRSVSMEFSTLEDDDRVIMKSFIGTNIEMNERLYEKDCARGQFKTLKIFGFKEI